MMKKYDVSSFSDVIERLHTTFRVRLQKD